MIIFLTITIYLFIHNFFDARIGRLATVTSNLQSYITPVVFVVQHNSIFVPLDDKPKIVAVKELKSVRNIQKIQSFFSCRRISIFHNVLNILSYTY